jgi:hypothetical protein
LSKRKSGSQWENRERQTTLLVPRLWSNESGQSATERLFAAGTRNDFRGVSGAFEFARRAERTFGVSRSAVSGWLKEKKEMMPELSETLAAAHEPPTLELDAWWSFVLKKANKRWLWIARCRQTRQVVADQARRPARSALVGAYGRKSLPLAPHRALFFGFLGRLSIGYCAGTTYGSWERVGRRRRTLNAGTTPCGNVLHGLCEKHYHFQRAT